MESVVRTRMTNCGLDHTVLVKRSRRFSVPIINGSPGIAYSIRECQCIFPYYLLSIWYASEPDTWALNWRF